MLIWASAVELLLLGGGCYTGVDAGQGPGSASAGTDGPNSGEDTNSADSDGEDTDDGDDNVPAEFEPSPGAMRRLTTAQYVNSIRDVFGIEIADAVELDLDETSPIFRSIGASIVGTSPSGVEMYRSAAFYVATTVFENRDDYPWLASCVPTSANDSCVRDALADVGLRLWRRPMDTDELDRYAALIDAPYEGGANPEFGFRYALAALIESPNFIYMPVVGEAATNDLWRYTGWEMASRLSYTIWNTTPDEELLQAAAQGGLVTVSGIDAQAQRMLEDPRAADVLARFFGEAWNVDRLTHLDKNPEVFPEWTPTIVDDYKTEFRLVLRDMMDRDADIRELFDGTQTFASPALAELYGLTPGDPTNTVEGEFSPVQLGERRHGLLTSGAVLAANSPTDRSSPTHRGVFVLRRLLCGVVPPPPADVDDTLPTDEEDGEPRSTRERLEEHVANPVCAACHVHMDPLGLVLEHYDGVGVWRDDENGFEIDPAGEYLGVSFEDAGGLATFLGSDDRTMSCIVRHGLSFATGRELGPETDAPTLETLGTTFAESGYGMRELMLGIVSSPSFRFLTLDSADGP